MEAQHDAKACSRCGRRFAAPAILEAARCPLCDGHLVPLDEAPFSDPPQKPKG